MRFESNAATRLLTARRSVITAGELSRYMHFPSHMENNPALIYLDWNVFVRIMEGDLVGLKEVLSSGRRSAKFAIPFSSSHVEEATGIEGQESEITARLEFISSVTGDLYFVNDLFNLGFREEHPQSVLSTLQSGDIGIDVNKLFANFISYESLRESRELLDLSPKELNNVSPQQAVEAIDRVLQSAELKEAYLRDRDVDFSFRGILHMVGEMTREHFNPMYEGWGLDPAEINYSSSSFTMAFSMFDSLGFWPDKKPEYEKGSRYYDAMHAFYGSYCDYVVSGDKRFRYKSMATYAMMDCPVRVLGSSEAENVLAEAV